MRNFSGSNWLAARARKTPVIVAVVIAAMLVVAGAVYAWPPAFGMMPPDGGGQIVQHNPEGQIFVYNITREAGGLPMTVSRNKTPWVKIAKKGNSYLISDPRGTGEAVITLPAPAR